MIQRREQIKRGPPLKPDVARAVLMQHHPRNRPPRPVAPMRAAWLSPAIPSLGEPSSSRLRKSLPASRRLERQAMRGFGDAQPPAAHEDVHMRERLAEGEDELVRIVNIAPENDR